MCLSKYFTVNSLVNNSLVNTEVGGVYKDSTEGQQSLSKDIGMTTHSLVVYPVPVSISHAGCHYVPVSIPQYSCVHCLSQYFSRWGVVKHSFMRSLSQSVVYIIYFKRRKI